MSRTYDAAGRVATIAGIPGLPRKHTIGMRSEFTYDDGDFIATLTTPYGMAVDGMQRYLRKRDEGVLA